MPLHAAGLDAERVGHLPCRPAFDVAQHEHLSLAWRQALEGAPDAPLLVRAHPRALGRAPGRGEEILVERERDAPPAPPPARALPVATGVDRYPAQPGPPGHLALARVFRGQEQLHEDLLTHVLRLVGITEEQPAETDHAGAVGAVELVVGRRAGLHARTVRHAQERRHRGASVARCLIARSNGAGATSVDRGGHPENTPWPEGETGYRPPALLRLAQPGVRRSDRHLVEVDRAPALGSQL